MRARVVRSGLGAVLLLIGVVWSLQGLGALGGSVMSGSHFWAWVGAACILGATVLFLTAFWPRRGR